MNNPPSDGGSRPGRFGRHRRAAGAAVATVLVAGAVAAAVTAVVDDRPAIVARAGQVMPFDLDSTVHTFTKTPGGGVQEVVADDPSDSRNIDLVRRHLRAEADRFTRGDFGDPATIHGNAMPGLRELRAGAASGVQVVYQESRSGARITYSTTDSALVAALHAWFDAQNTDHAAPGMGGSSRLSGASTPPEG